MNKVASKPRTPTALVTTQKFVRLMQIWDRQSDLEQLRQRRGQSLMAKEDWKEKKKLQIFKEIRKTRLEHIQKVRLTTDQVRRTANDNYQDTE